MSYHPNIFSRDSILTFLPKFSSFFTIVTENFVPEQIQISKCVESTALNAGNHLAPGIWHVSTRGIQKRGIMA